MHSKTVKTPKNAKVESPAIIFVYLKNVDDIYKKAIANGAKSLVAPETVPWGERQCHILDPDGHRWQLAEVVKKDGAGPSLGLIFQSSEEAVSPP